MCKKIQSKTLTSTLFGLAVLLLLAVSPARALTPVTACGQTLDVPGGKYILTVDLDCSGTLANGINIAASSVFSPARLLSPWQIGAVTIVAPAGFV